MGPSLGKKHFKGLQTATYYMLTLQDLAFENLTLARHSQQ